MERTVTGCNEIVLVGTQESQARQRAQEQWLKRLFLLAPPQEREMAASVQGNGLLLWSKGCIPAAPVFS